MILKKFKLQKIRPTVALSGDDRLLESMQEFRIFGREDHIHDFQNDNFFREHRDKTQEQGKHQEKHYTGIFTRHTKCTGTKSNLKLLFMET